MEKERLEGLLIDYIDGKLSEADRSAIEQELAQNKEAHRVYEQLREVIAAMEKSKTLEPGARLKDSFEKLLKEEMTKLEPAFVETSSRKQAKTVLFQPIFYRAAAAIVLVMAGVAIGFLINKNQQREDDLLALKKEVAATKQIMLLMIDNTQSASQRIQGVNVALGIDKADDDVVRALAKTMNEDPNTNVRLAALEALSKFHQEPGVRKVLIQSLAKQNDPVVQIALIQLMVRMKEKGVVKDLERIIDDSQTIKAVKDEAYSGILKLS